MIWFACKQCGRRDGRPEEQAGTLVFCTCGQGNRVPWESDVEAPAPAAVPAQPVPPRRLSFDEEPTPTRAPRPRRRLSDWGEAKRHDPAFCFNHQETAAERSCDACKEQFCDTCLVVLQGRALCGPCKNFEVRSLLRPGSESGMAIFACIVGLLSAPVAFALTIIPLGMQQINTATMMVCSGIGLVLPLVATFLGISALMSLNRDPRLRGRSLAVLGLVAGLAGSLWCSGTLITSLLHVAME